MAINIAEVEARFEEVNRQIATLQKEKEHLIKLRAEYNAEPVKVFENFEDIVWEEKAKTAVTGFLSGWLGKRIVSWKEVQVQGHRWYRYPRPVRFEDWDAIGRLGCRDVTAKGFWICRADKPNDTQESRNQFAREYAGGLNKHLSHWLSEKTSAEMRAAYLETHDDPGDNYAQPNPPRRGRKDA